MTKTVSSRIPKDLHDKLRERCNQEGCNTNDFIRDVLESELEQESQDQEENSSGPDRNTTPKPQITARLIDDEPKPDDPTTWRNHKTPQTIEVNFNPKDYEIEKAEPKPTVELIPTPTITIQDNSNKPQVDMVLFNGKYIPKAEVYEI